MTPQPTTETAQWLARQFDTCSRAAADASRNGKSRAAAYSARIALEGQAAFHFGSYANYKKFLTA